MGFFKKLFGIEEDDQQEFVANDNNSNAVSQANESVSTKLNYHDFFGIDLTESPNSEWIEDDYEFNSNGDKIRNFHYYGIDSDEWYFSDCKAKVIGDGGTNFFFVKEFDLQEAMDIVFLIERDLIHHGDYEYQKCIRKYRDKLDSIVPMLTWELGDKSVMFDRDAITGDMQVSIWTPFRNKAFLGEEVIKDIEPSPADVRDESKLERISINNFFGIDLESAPNGNWRYVGEADDEKTFEFTDIDEEKYVFKSCIASVNEDGGTDFYFAMDYYTEGAQKIIFIVEQAFGHEGIRSLSECNSHYISRIHNTNSMIEWKHKGCEITYIYMQDGGTMNIVVKTPFYNSKFLDNDEMVFEDRIVTSRGFNIPIGMEKFNAQVELIGESALFFAKNEWIDEDNKPLLMASMLVNGEPYAFNLETRDVYFKYSSNEIEQKMKEGYQAVIAVTDYDLREDDIQVELYVQFVESKEDSTTEKNSYGKIVKQYATTYELDYIDGQDHHQHKVIKNANMNSFVAGIKYRENYEELLAKLEEGMELQIKPEPNNEFDPDALAVFNGEDHLGYIPKKDIPAVALNMIDGCTTAEIDYVDEEHIDLVIPVTFPGLETMSDEELEGFRYYKTERTKYETGYQENSSPITKEEFLEGIKQQRENL